MELDKNEYSIQTLAKVVDVKTGLNGSWSQDPGLVSKQADKIII